MYNLSDEDLLNSEGVEDLVDEFFSLKDIKLPPQKWVQNFVQGYISNILDLDDYTKQNYLN